MAIDSVDTIKRRMIRNASKLWGFHDSQDINSFDPVLGLILGALAQELHHLNNEMSTSEGRIVEKLLELLFNQSVFTHFPSHGVARANPTQARVNINQFYQFYAEKSQPGKKEGTKDKKNVFFTPTTDFTLFKGEIKYLIGGKNLYEIDGLYKELLEELPKGMNPDYSKLYLGLKIDQHADLLDGLSLFFSFKNLQNEYRLYHLIHSAEWKINGHVVTFDKGYINSNNQNALSDLLKQSENVSFKALSYINKFYQKKFMTLAENKYSLTNLKEQIELPALINQLTEEGKINDNGQELIWIEINLAQPISSEDIADLTILSNCFTVVNRTLNESSFSISKGTNVIPLNTEDLFFDIKGVTDSNNEEYAPKSSSTSDTKKTYVLRQGGISRFDSRNARETINNLIDVVRNESAAFSARGTDLISSELKELDQILSRLEQRTNQDESTRDLQSYIMLKTDLKYDKLMVQYWTVNGELSNRFRPGTKLNVYRGLDIDDKRCGLITQTIGGKNKLNKEDKLNTLRRSLLSKGRIVSVEDIKALCYEHFGSNLNQVEVKKGVQLDVSPGKGMMRTLDIHITLHKTSDLSDEDLWHLSQGINTTLEQESINLLPYRVFVEK